MENLAEYKLTLVTINDEYHLYDLITNEIYEAMSITYINQLIELWNKNRYYKKNCGIIKLVIQGD
ncbi:hypothetical protein CWE04_09920 [Thomasclavelia cocleata]|uniref:Uncharacterized protein n=1 Tax=Thomasclavelia cocleata TaxID=69824 RepID=A0A1I0H0Q6_9FIRM|nr:hypothetical protein [Thomasclavelia cocleata]MCR1961793.1 hypothetical protein [Thomasclavelia cocleata]NDO43495.1 hypothetical protein [Thomasclavelia cocleata]PJN80172.1 hypothetical protein CWE04_09920 [Thomasclavelia cocleata]SET77083.1 hypothetical protein SAMN04489758_13921 [Thomasclavelia cocleata]